MSNKIIKPKVGSKLKPKVGEPEFDPDAEYNLGDFVTYNSNIYELVFHVTKSSGTDPESGSEWESYTPTFYDPATSFKKYEWVTYNMNVYQLINPSIYPGIQEDPEVNTNGSWSDANPLPALWSGTEFYTTGNIEYAPSVVLHNGSWYRMIADVINSEIAPDNGIYNNWLIQLPPVPDAPANLVVTYNNADNSLEFTWEKPTIDPDQIKIYYSVIQNEYTEATTILWNDITLLTSTCFYNYLIEFSPFSDGTSYSFGITAINSSGYESLKSNIVPVDIPPLDGLIIPTGLEVTYNSDTNTLDFIWDDAGVDNPPQFYVYYANPGAEMINRLGDPILLSDITDFSNDNLHYNYPVPNNTLTNGNTYDLAITASDNMDESDFSNIVSINYILPIVNPEPPIITAVINQNASTTIYWIPPSTTGEPELSGYEINYSFDGGTTNITIDISDPSANSYQITGLDEFNGASCQGNIKAINVDGGFSVESYFLLAPLVEINITVSDLSSQQDLTNRVIKLNWSANDDTTIFALQYTISGYTEIIFHVIPPNEVIGDSQAGFTYYFNPNAIGSAIYDKAYNIKIYVCFSTIEEFGIVYLNGAAGPSNLTSCLLPTQVPDTSFLEPLPGDGIAILVWDFQLESANNGEAYIANEINTFDGGSPILYYTIQCTNPSDIPDISYNPVLDISNDNPLFYVVKNLTNAIDYTFRVQAVNAVGPSEWSNSVTVTPAGFPTNPYQLTVTDISYNCMTFQWDYPDSSGYILTIDNLSNLITVASNVNSYTINNLKEGADHFISFISLDEAHPKFGMYGQTLPYTPDMPLPPGQSSYNILINDQIVNFVPVDISGSTSGTQVLLNDSNYYSTPTLVNYVNINISGQDALISSSFESALKGIYNTVISTSETNVPVPDPVPDNNYYEETTTTIIYKGLLQILDGTSDLQIGVEGSNDIFSIELSSLPSNSDRLALVAIKDVTSTDLDNSIFGKFYFKLMDSTSGGSFVSSGFNLPFYYSSTNIKQTTETLSILRFNTSTNSYDFVTNAILQNSIFAFDLSGNSSYTIVQQVPDPPTQLPVTQTGNLVYANFTAPTFVGAGPITSYIVTYRSNVTNINKTKSGTTSPIMVPSLTIGELYAFWITAVNSFGESSLSNKVDYTPTGSGTITGDPHITTIYGHSYFLPNVNGRFLLFNNKNPEYNLYITADCYFLNNQELQNAAFTSKYLTDYTFMRTVNIKFRNQSFEINMNTLEITGKTNNEIIIEKIISDKLAIGKFYSQNRRKELGLSLRFNGRSRKIKLIYKDIVYTIKVASDLGCADHRNDISINGPNMGSGYGAIISSNHILKICNL